MMTAVVACVSFAGLRLLLLPPIPCPTPFQIPIQFFTSAPPPVLLLFLLLLLPLLVLALLLVLAATATASTSLQLLLRLGLRMWCLRFRHLYRVGPDSFEHRSSSQEEHCLGFQFRTRECLGPLLTKTTQTFRKNAGSR